MLKTNKQTMHKIEVKIPKKINYLRDCCNEHKNMESQ